MKFHLVNSAYVRSPERLVSPRGSWRMTSLKVRYGLIEHPRLGPILIDAGYAPRVVSGPGRSIPLRTYGKALSPILETQGHPTAVLSTLGYDPADVRHIILSHLHADHVGYLDHFPEALIHVPRECLNVINASRHSLGLLEQGIFRELLPLDPNAHTLKAYPEPTSLLPEALANGGYMGADILGDGTIIAVPLPGHAVGHHGILLPILKHPHLYAVDAAWTLAGIESGSAPRFPASLVTHHLPESAHTARRVHAFSQTEGSISLCHDPDPTEWDFTP